MNKILRYTQDDIKRVDEQDPSALLQDDMIMFTGMQKVIIFVKVNGRKWLSTQVDMYI